MRGFLGCMEEVGAPGEHCYKMTALLEIVQMFGITLRTEI